MELIHGGGVSSFRFLLPPWDAIDIDGSAMNDPHKIALIRSLMRRIPGEGSTSCLFEALAFTLGVMGIPTGVMTGYTILSYLKSRLKHLNIGGS